MAKHNIKAIKRDNLNVAAYDQCISQSSHSKIYARAWYLDVLTDDWYALVRGDYEAVMPLPLRRKWGWSYVYQPMMMQQLGVFSPTHDYDGFYKMAIARHLHLDYTFHGSAPKDFLHTPKPNLILAIDGDLETIKNACSSNRKRDLKKAEKGKLIWRDLDHWPEIGRLITEPLKGGPYDGIQAKLEHLMDIEKPNGEIRAAGVYQDDVCIFFLLYGLDASRIYYLLPIALSDEAQKFGAATFCIFHLIEQYKKQYSVFDFEGSAIPGVRRFYESFGAHVEPYYHFTKTFLHFMKHAR